MFHVAVRRGRRTLLPTCSQALVTSHGLLLTVAIPAIAYPRPGLTERVSVASDGTEGNAVSSWFSPPTLSADGRYVAFDSFASNLVPSSGDTRFSIFVHDRETGTTERVPDTAGSTDGFTVAPAISADGRYVAFDSNASTLAPDDTNEDTDVFVHDRETGQTERVSVASDGSEADWDSHGSAISADGRYVAFYSLAGNLVPGGTGQRGDVFVHDRETGRTKRVSVAADGTEANKSSYGAASPAISADGRYVAFGSRASNLVPGDTNDTPDVLVHDRGLPLGVTGDLSVNEDSGINEVAGRVTLSGTMLSQATDPVGDGSSGADPAGADLTGAEVIVRPEEQDVLVRPSLDSLPSQTVSG